MVTAVEPATNLLDWFVMAKTGLAAPVFVAEPIITLAHPDVTPDPLMNPRRVLKLPLFPKDPPVKAPTEVTPTPVEEQEA